ncbi:hypothetical protein COCC4DRAFT_153409 [Bipolaris maydis ATCC 48331]|uniref:Uncharacterized protein n=2 Tax=Cochliobolus heterostrophus TaxID=5016 RepID=M2UAW6_COCH5|nr:uncharacterized protein COCC4DRAFT_153409 [Bipolaris maydis ATCC 48331]EMD85143.1 hypothetical protein COCHEDRAFT_1188541 [Bipolaris maydis C5]KAH7564289.1 hypothetical protein BM1_01336 [Bipolaris maydis]ENH99398.1 hypothetical protein COCC4DRAFT_153409 [Bipolaris maydis ATCC 48331]KAJ5026914.1 hypothetical protein J3E73DRAFT_381780 [Bipolaris maydis]KAJ5059342.1 hypothetical protein J3E74DRAFT_465913 [Bipolaris maydis]
MAEQSQPRDLSSLSAQFRSAIRGLTHQWGFAIVRTAYANDNDDAQWAAALKKLHDYATPSDSGAEMDPDTFALPVISDSAFLRGADHASVRKAFKQWIADFVGRERNKDDDDNEEWPSDVRRDVCIVIDEAALALLLSVPDFVRGKVPNLDLEPWVTVVDAEDPANIPYRGGGPYMGFTRAYVRVLSQLFDDLDSQSLEKLSPIRVYDGQIPLFTGSSHGKLVDPPGGVEGRYKFPRGTPRGAQGVQAMLEEIERAVGRGIMGS